MLCSNTFLLAQAAKNVANYTVSGSVKDKKTGEELIGVSIAVEELKGTGAITNEYGFYSITLPSGEYTLNVTAIGFATETRKISLTTNQKLNIAVGDNEQVLTEVVVSSKKKDENVTKAQMGVEKLDVAAIAKIPVLLGEKDIIKTMQLMPGIKTAGEGNSGFYVRGGGSDQNLILLDEAPVYNASHLLGFFSTFNSDAIKDVAIYKGTAPAQYGGRLSSVLDIKMNEGNDQKYHVSGGIGIISSKLNLEGPIVKDKGSFLVTGRRTYVDVFTRLSNNAQLKNATLYFYDVNMKANYRINAKNRVFLSGYFGRDVLGVQIFGIDWGNTTGTLRWNSIISDKLFSNTSLIYSNYNYKIGFNVGKTDVSITSKIRDYNLKQEFQYFLNPKNNIRFGANVIQHTITPGQIEATAESSINSAKLQDRQGVEAAVYANNEWAATKDLNISYGLRGAFFDLLGAGDFYNYNPNGTLNNVRSYKAGESVQSYFNLEPRVSAAYKVGEAKSIKAAYARNTQNLHLLSNSTAGSPTDSWIMSSQNTRPQIADQFSLGYFQNFADNGYEFSVETYYKTMQNQVDYKNGANIQANELVEGELLYGQGRAYGVELFLKKKTGKFTGWVGYTLSKSERQINGINDDNWYNAKQDRTHDVSVVGIYEFNKKWSVSAAFVYYTGSAVTFPSGKYKIDGGQTVFLYSERNGYRMPDYHRLDVGATLTIAKTKRFESAWNFSCYNAYGRKNAYAIDFQDDPNDASKTQVVQTTLFTFVPSVTWNFKF